MKRSTATNGTRISSDNSKERKAYNAANDTDLDTNAKSNGIKLTKNKSEGAYRDFLHFTFIPLCLLIMIPNLVIVMWYTSAKCNGSFLELLRRFYEHGVIEFLFRLWTSINVLSPIATSVIFGYSVFALILMIIIPGRRTEGPMTSKGHIPVYKENGFSCYCVTMVAFVLLTIGLKLFGRTPTIVYDQLDEFIASLTIISYIFCFFLYIKGRFWPSTSDSGSSGNFIFDYFWGLELYPRVFDIDVKVYTNCRFGMTVWSLLVCIYTLKSYELHGGFVDSAMVSAVLQLVYITKFFWWEGGYMKTIDIKLDRAGFYICWGCLVYVPGVYASVSMYLVNQPVHLGPVLSSLILFAGLFSCAMNYIADRQKQVVRSTNGNCVIWGRKPEVIRATYQLENGEMHHSLLLVSGFWGVARHFHYVPELLLAFLWTVPALFHNLLPFSYLISLICLLLHRTYRDDLVCKSKYNEHWDEYVCRVPYKIIPCIF